MSYGSQKQFEVEQGFERIRKYHPRILTWILKKYFPNMNSETVITFNGKIYARPDGKGKFGDDLMAHELTHVVQQGGFFGSVLWWIAYVKDPDFRLEQEIRAYRKQFEYAREMYSHKKLMDVTYHICSLLSGPLYNNMLTFDQARRRITE